MHGLALGPEFNGLPSAREGMQAAKSGMNLGREEMFFPELGCGLEIQPQRIIGLSIRADESVQQQVCHQGSNGGDSMSFKESSLQALKARVGRDQRWDGGARSSADDA